MSPDPRPPQQGPYLSTEDIVARVRVAQGKSRLLAFRGVLLLCSGVLVVAALLYNFRRVGPADRRPPAASVEHAPQATPAAQPADATPEPAAAETPPAKVPMLRVIVKGRAGIITLDGKRMTVDRNWSAASLHGRHVVGVRCGSVCLRRSIVLQGTPITLIFDCAARKIEQK